MYKKIFLFLYFVAILFSQQELYEPPHNLVYQNNLAVAASGSYTKIIPSWLKPQQPALEQPFSYGFFKFTSTYPSVSSRVPLNLLGQVFWIWGEEHPEKYRVFLTPDECGQPYYSYTAISDPWLEGTLTVSIENRTKSYSVYLEKNGSKDNLENPFKIDFSKQELEGLATKSDSYKNPILPKLILDFRGNIFVKYYVFVMEYFLVRGPKGETKCEARSRSFVKIYSYPVADHKEYDVEHSPASFYLVQPLDKEQLTIDPEAKAVFLTNFYANKIFLNSQNFSAYNVFAQYKVKSDDFGFQNIERINFHKPLAFGGDITSKSSFLFLNSSYFLNKTYNFAHQFYTQVKLPYSIGQRVFTFIIIDDFSQSYKFDNTLFFRAAIGLFSTNSSINISTSDKNVPLPNPVQQGYILESKISDVHRPAFFVFFHEQKPFSIFGYIAIFVLILLGLKIFVDLPFKKD
ncbi:MAG: hypothetical protein N3D10_03910 [Candidatus Micrarchaeota archaeon]|nr:hypothetical protein [Candidatus Micrarchaeota archaeon]